uniref:Methyltransferase domain-containing protein n=2 Tax=Lepeophtheirus salmonis TaxID=72036 RepID=A0A0K2TYR7_LEPSM
MNVVFIQLLPLVYIFASCYGSEQPNYILSDKDSTLVLDHYMNYPYPYIKPKQDDTKSPPPIYGATLQEINHYFYNGFGDLGRTGTFRIIIAGGGTGSSLLHYSYIFRNLNVQIVYLDFSKKSLDIARARAENYGFYNISFIHSSIFNIPKLNLGIFDYIDCYGVLHHLPDPNVGLRVLKDILATNGGMFLMLYGYYGRQGIYSMQDTLKIMEGNKSLTLKDEVKIGRIVYNNLKEEDWINVSGLGSEEAKSDVGFYDLYLNKQDRAFTIPELYEYIEDKGGLHVVNFYGDQYRESLDYCPKHLKKLNTRARYAVNEVIIGHESKQVIFVSKKKSSKASLDDLDNIPFFQFSKIGPILEVLSSNIKNVDIRVTMKLRYTIPRRFTFPISRFSLLYLKLILRNTLTVKDIIEFGMKNFKYKEIDHHKFRKRLLKDFNRTIGSLILHGFVLLRHKDFPVMEQRETQDEIIKVELLNTSNIIN